MNFRLPNLLRRLEGEWLERLCKHVPGRHEHMARYYGRYSSRTLGAEREPPEVEQPDDESASQARQAAKAAWAKLIRKVYEVDPLPDSKHTATALISRHGRERTSYPLIESLRRHGVVLAVPQR